MSRHDPMMRIRHMLDHAREATELVNNRSRSNLDTDRLLNLALTRLMEIVGEAVTGMAVSNTRSTRASTGSTA
jgi:uncharacterized protein with HEPN domain